MWLSSEKNFPSPDVDGADISRDVCSSSTNKSSSISAIQTVANVAEQSAAGSEELASSSEELNAQASSLRTLVDFYRGLRG